MIAEPTGTDGLRAIGRTWHLYLLRNSFLAEMICWLIMRSQALCNIIWAIHLLMPLIILWSVLSRNATGGQMIPSGGYLI